MPHITPPGVEWPEGDGFKEALQRIFFLQNTIEFGCGRGRLAPCFDHKLYTGIDICLPAVEMARAAHILHQFAVDDGHSPIGSFDALLAHTVLLHIPDELLRQTISRFRTPVVVVSEITGRQWRNNRDNPPVFNRDLSEYSAAFKEIGYRMHRVEFVPYPHYADGELSMMVFHRS